MRAFLSLILVAPLSGCMIASVADTAVDIVTLPVDVASKTVDLATTSQSEADEKRGREIRKAEEKAGKEAREREKACKRAQAKGEPCPPTPQPPASS